MKLFKYMDKTILIITIILFAIGTVMIFSASNVSTYIRNANSPYYYLIRQIVILVVAFIISIFFLLINVKTTSKLSTLLTYLFIVSLFMLFLFGKITNHAQSWFKLGFFNVQPSEFLKVFMIIWAAKYYDLKEKKLDNYTTALYPAMIILIAFAAIFLQPDLGTALIVLLIFAFIFVLAPISKDIKYKIVGLGLAFAFLGVLVVAGFGSKILSETQMQRITSVISSNPCSEENYYTDGNQICNGYIAINNGGLMGKGLGNSIQKYLYLPEAHTDFIFCIIIEELGLLFGLFIILLYIVLLAKIIILGRKCSNNRDALICYGGAFYIFIHIMVNLLGVFGIIPMTGVPLPFMSYGGSYLLSLSIILSVIQRISFETRLKLATLKGNE